MKRKLIFESMHTIRSLLTWLMADSSQAGPNSVSECFFAQKYVLFSRAFKSHQIIHVTKLCCNNTSKDCIEKIKNTCVLGSALSSVHFLFTVLRQTTRWVISNISTRAKPIFLSTYSTHRKILNNNTILTSRRQWFSNLDRRLYQLHRSVMDVVIALVLHQTTGYSHASPAQTAPII